MSDKVTDKVKDKVGGEDPRGGAAIARARKTELESSANPQTGKSTGKSALRDRVFSGEVSDRVKDIIIKRRRGGRFFLCVGCSYVVGAVLVRLRVIYTPGFWEKWRWSKNDRKRDARTCNEVHRREKIVAKKFDRNPHRALNRR